MLVPQVFTNQPSLRPPTPVPLLYGPDHFRWFKWTVKKKKKDEHPDSSKVDILWMFKKKERNRNNLGGKESRRLKSIDWWTCFLVCPLCLLTICVLLFCYFNLFGPFWWTLTVTRKFGNTIKLTHTFIFSHFSLEDKMWTHYLIFHINWQKEWWRKKSDQCLSVILAPPTTPEADFNQEPFFQWTLVRVTNWIKMEFACCGLFVDSPVSIHKYNLVFAGAIVYFEMFSSNNRLVMWPGLYPGFGSMSLRATWNWSGRWISYNDSFVTFWSNQTGKRALDS